MRVSTIAVGLAFVAISTAAVPCTFNTDCNVGSKCMKERLGAPGVCVGGLQPGRPKEQAPLPDYMRDFRDLNRTRGEQCSFNTECGVGSACVKESGKLYGVCIPKR
jgi:hypothetical protein